MPIKMKYLSSLVLWLVCSAAIAWPTMEHCTTENGARVDFVPTNGLPILDAQLVFDAGSARDSEQKGVAALTSLLLDQGAGGMSAQAISEAMEDVGAQLGTSVSRDFTSVSYRSLTDPAALTSSWAVLKKVINQPDFPERDFNREKDRTLLGIKRRQESPGTLAQLALYKSMYKEHPYANPIQGEQDTVNALEKRDLRDFYNEHYVANNLIVVMVGGVSREQAADLISDLVNGLPAVKKPKPVQAVSVGDIAVSIHKEYPSQPTHLMYSLPVLMHNDADYFALYVGNHILGGSGFNSRIVKEIREKRGLAYSAYSYFRPMIQPGPFLLGLQTKNEKVAEATTATKQTLSEFIQSGPSAEELDSAKKNLTGGFALRLDSNKKLLGNVVSIVASGVPLNYLETYLEKINAVTQEQIKEAFQRRVQMTNMTLVTVGATVEQQP